MIEIAKKLNGKGLRVIPVDGNKRPTRSWKQYQETQTLSDIEKLFDENTKGIALICGQGIEAIDFDCKYDLDDNLFSKYLAILKQDKLSHLVNKLVIQSTINGGYHFIYRTKIEDGNKKLASRKSTKEEIASDPHSKQKVLIETRAKGGYVVIAPSQGYKLMKGSSFDKVQEITDDERNALINIAKSFNEIDIKIERTKEHKRNFNSTTIEDFNSKQGYIGIVNDLIAHGWTSFQDTDERVYLTRPGKENAISGDVHKSKCLFKSFTTSSEFQNDKGYDAFAVRSLLEHRGSSKDAYNDLYNQGYGIRIHSSRAEKKESTNNTSIQKNWIEEIQDRKFDFNAPIVNFKSILNYRDGIRNIKIAEMGSLGAIVGTQKSRKTQLLYSIIESALDKKNKLYLNLDIGQKDILIIDTEQPYARFQKLNKKTLINVGIEDNCSRYHSYNLRKYNWSERIEIIDSIIKSRNNWGLIVIDGIVDICKDFMNSDHSIDTVQQLMNWTDTSGAMLIAALHLTKSADRPTPRGALGTELQNKVDFMLQTTKDNSNVTQIKCRETREDPFSTYYINQNNERLFVCDEDGNEILESKKF